MHPPDSENGVRVDIPEPRQPLNDQVAATLTSPNSSPSDRQGHGVDGFDVGGWRRCLTPRRRLKRQPWTGGPQMSVESAMSAWRHLQAAGLMSELVAETLLEHVVKEDA